MSENKRSLGRGLEALLSGGTSYKPNTPPVETPAQVNQNTTEATTTTGSHNSLKQIPVEFIRKGKYQPRHDMTDEGLEELASSIKAQGIIQPIVIRPISDGRYEIIAGERRWRAAQLAGLSEVPCLIKDIPDEAAIAMALIENIQREDLNAVEEATALQRLVDEFELTHQAVAEAVGKSRTAVSNLLRLLSLNSDTKRLLENGDLEMGHARALLALEGVTQSDTARQVVAKGLTVRETEKLVKKILHPITTSEKTTTIDPNIQRLQIDIAEKLGAKVAIQHSNKGKGKLVIEYNNLDELDGILAHIQ